MGNSLKMELLSLSLDNRVRSRMTSTTLVRLAVAKGDRSDFLLGLDDCEMRASYVCYRGTIP
jgi:hypothetical protein